MYKATDDTSGLIDVYTVRGYEFHSLLEHWEKANLYFEHAQTLMGDDFSLYKEAYVRLLLGRTQQAIKQEHIQTALKKVQIAQGLIQDYKLLWWEPASLYWLGILQKKEGFNDLAKETFFLASNYAQKDGCPDYLPLIFLEIANLSTESQSKFYYLEQCISALENRARFYDKIKCYEGIGHILSKQSDLTMQARGFAFLSQSQDMTKKIAQEILG